MIHVTIKGEKATAVGPFPFTVLKLLATLPGRKKWDGQKSVSFDATPINIRKLKESTHEFNFDDQSNLLADIDELANMSTQHAAVALVTKYKPAMPLRDYQTKAVALSKGRAAYAYLFEMGLGKTCVTIADIGILHTEYGIIGAMIVAPKGVDAQWAEDEIPKHIDPRLQYDIIQWNGGKMIDGKRNKLANIRLRQNRMTFFTINIDALTTDRGFEAASEFFKATGRRAAMVVDESHRIKNFMAARTKAAITLGQMVDYRRTLTGTPIAKSIEDAFAQFYFLDPRILGHKYLTSFRSRYCIMGGYENRVVVGQTNVEEFYSLIAPHSFRLTKAEALDLPQKLYVNVEYDLDTKTRKAYDDLKKHMLTKLEDGTMASVKQATTLVLRLQELICGRLMREDETYEDFGSQRISELINIIEQINGPVVIWARFQSDIEKIVKALNATNLGKARSYYGETTKKERDDNKKAFLRGDFRFFVATAAAGGTGLNLQGDCQNVIYYSQDFNAINRWQSEDRTHRHGMNGQMTYYILLARKTVDRHINNNLAGKKSISALTFDQIRAMING